MQALLRSAQSSQAQYPDYIPKVASSLLCHLERWSFNLELDSHHLAGPDRKLGCTTVGELLAYIDRRLGHKPSLDELAGRTALSRAAFTCAFKSAVGLSPHQYVNARRVAKAKKLLAETDLDLAFIAQETGFSSQSHFTCLFHSLAGCTPAKFRLMR